DSVPAQVCEPPPGAAGAAGAGAAGAAGAGAAGACVTSGAVVVESPGAVWSFPPLSSVVAPLSVIAPVLPCLSTLLTCSTRFGGNAAIRSSPILPRKGRDFDWAAHSGSWL